MLKMGREKLRNIGVIGNVEYVQANAEALPFLIIRLIACYHFVWFAM